MNNELRIHLRLIVNIPNHILLLIERYLGQMKMKETMKSYVLTNGSYCYFCKQFHLRGLSFLHNKNAQGGITIPVQLLEPGYHSYGPKCMYNRFLGSIIKRDYQITTTIHNSHILSIFKH